MNRQYVQGFLIGTLVAFALWGLVIALGGDLT